MNRRRTLINKKTSRGIYFLDRYKVTQNTVNTTSYLSIMFRSVFKVGNIFSMAENLKLG